jgi:hypothetical protein
LKFVCGIYGYWFTNEYSVRDLTFIPLVTNHAEHVTIRKSRKGRYSLTGLIVAGEISDSTLFNLAGVLTLLEQRDVLLSEPKELVFVDEGRLFDNFPSDLGIPPTRGEYNSILPGNVFSSDSHKLFVEKTLGRLEDTAFCDATKYRSLFFKAVETFRQRENYLDINYFLLYSGLEAYARACQTYEGNCASEPIAKQLTSLGFCVYQERPSELIRAVQTYTDLRNALFHRNELHATKKINKVTNTISMSDYYIPFRTLVIFATLRASGFNDDQINWDGWVHGQWYS